MSETKKTSKEPIPQVTLTKSEDTELNGVTDVGEAIAAILPGLEEQTKRSQEFFAEIRAEVAKMAPEFCLDHEEEPLEVDWEKTFGHSWRAQKLDVYYKPKCHICVKEDAEAFVNARWLKMGIPKKVVHATLDNFILEDNDATPAKDRKRALEKVKRQVRHKSGFILMVGKVGTGKSHLGAAAIKAIGGGEFITQYDLVGALRQSYEKGGQEELVEKYRTAKCFVLDEISTEVKGSDIAPLLYRILSYRYDQGLLTVLTSNETLETIRDVLGIRLADRIRESFVLANFTWESARKPDETNKA